MSATSGMCILSLIFARACAASIVGTVARTISQPARSKRKICDTVASTSSVLVLVIDCMIEKYHGVTAEGIVESALDKVHIIEGLHYDNLVISIKSSDVNLFSSCHKSGKRPLQSLRFAALMSSRLASPT